MNLTTNELRPRPPVAYPENTMPVKTFIPGIPTREQAKDMAAHVRYVHIKFETGIATVAFYLSKARDQLVFSGSYCAPADTRPSKHSSGWTRREGRLRALRRLLVAEPGLVLGTTDRGFLARFLKKSHYEKGEALLRILVSEMKKRGYQEINWLKKEIG